MMIYLEKFIACSALLLLVYHLLLKNKAMYRFNRVFLLASLVFSIAIPFITFEQHFVDIPVVIPAQEVLAETPLQTQGAEQNFTGLQPEQAYTLAAEDAPVAVNQTAAIKNPVNFYFTIALVIYGLVTGLLLYRFIRNLYKIRRMALQNEHVDYQEASLVLIPQRLTPHSFFKFIFLNREDYRGQKIADNILCHELEHVRQRHSADVVFVELLQVFCWFNPLVILYRRSIQLNHEFLADEAVLNLNDDVTDYQRLLLNSMATASGLAVTSQFNYSLTKKRLMMMTKKTSVKNAAFTRLATFLLSAVVFIVFCNAAVSKKAIAPAGREVKGLVAAKPDTSGVPHPARAIKFPPPLFKYEHTKQGVSQTVLNEYAAIVAKYPLDPNHHGRLSQKVSEADQQKMISLYKQMSIAQQEQQLIGFGHKGVPKPGVKVTADMLELYKSNNDYGISINKKRVKNSDLNNYSADDLVLVYASSKWAARIAKTKYHHVILLMTNDFYKADREKALAEKDETFMVIRPFVVDGDKKNAAASIPVNQITPRQSAKANNKPAKAQTITQVSVQSPTLAGFDYPHTEKGASPELLHEYEAIVTKYQTGWAKIPPLKRFISPADKERMKQLYAQMNVAQQNQQHIGFMYSKGGGALPPVTPTKKQLESFKDSLLYGVWLNWKHIGNNELNQYKPADFGQVSISKLSKNAINRIKYAYQVNLMTVEFYKAYVKKASSEKNKRYLNLVFRDFVVKEDKS